MNSKYEMKICPRCGSKFECKMGNITQCKCYTVQLTNQETMYIKEKYDDCLCYDCLEKVKKLLKEKNTLGYYSNLKSNND